MTQEHRLLACALVPNPDFLMHHYNGFEDTICAISTPPGTGGIGIVRLSGRDALAVAEKIFVRVRSPLPRPPHQGEGDKVAADNCTPPLVARLPARQGGGWGGGEPFWKTFTVRSGWVKDPVSQEMVDQALATFMRGPKSYTGEDIVEISCHGGFAAVKAVLEACLKSGARLAEPGEFTKRAFLNGRVDLAQAEAVLDVIHAKTGAFLRATTHQLKGELSLELESIREKLLSVFGGIEALLNFPEDDTDAGQAARLKDEVVAALERIHQLLSTAQAGRILKEGIRIVICGKPNVGKSSLLNALLREPRAIVTDVAGTTRDVLEETADIDGVPVSFVDTAGILTPRDKVEEEAVRRSRLSIQSADIVLLVFDRSAPLSKADRELAAELKEAHTIVVLNKADLLAVLDAGDVNGALPGRKVVAVSCLNKSGLDELRHAVKEAALGNAGMEGRGLILSNLRHIEALDQARTALQRALTSLSEKTPFEMISSDIKSAITCLDAITGRDIDADVIDQIFSRFCIGK